MSADISSKNYFEIFSLPESFQVDTEQLTRAYRELQAQYHPDRFVNAGDRERRVALQTTSILNDAYETLRSPLRRAAYLLGLHGVDPEEHNQEHLGGEFLLKQMELREELEGIGRSEDMDALDALKARVEGEIEAELATFERLYGSADYADAKPVYNRLQFLCKLRREIDQIEEKLLDY